MKNHWIEQSNNKLDRNDFILRGIGKYVGAIYDVQHPTLKQFLGGELVPLSTRIVVHPVHGVRLIWTPEASHGRMVKAKAEAIKEELLGCWKK